MCLVLWLPAGAALARVAPVAAPPAGITGTLSVQYAGTGVLLDLGTLQGTPSTAVTFTVNGLSLTGNVAVTVPAGFEVALTSAPTYATSLNIVPQAGVVNNVGISVRLSGAALGTFTGNLSATNGSAAPVDIALTGRVQTTNNPVATLTGISPTTLTPGTTLVTFYGRNFAPGLSIGMYPGTYVTFGPTTYISPGQATAQVTVGAAGARFTGYCSAGNPAPGGGGNTPPGTVNLTIDPGAPIITRFSPTIGAPGTLVTITGQGFLESGANLVTFNGVTAALAFTPSGGQLTVRVPAGATTGPISVATAAGTFTTTTPFVVPPVFFEDFENGTKTSYTPASVALLSGGWTLGEALIGTTAGADKFNGTKSARLRGGGYVEMDVDKPNGAGVVTVSAATYATETGVSFVPEISTDGGVTYTSLLTGPAPVLTSTLTAYSFTANRPGNVRLRFSSTNTTAASNPRLNLDDIGITNYPAVTATRPGQALPALQVYPNPTQNRLHVVTGRPGATRVTLLDLAGRTVLKAQPLPAGQQLVLPAHLPSGSYLLRVECQDEQRVVRVQKQ